jgi:fucose permease
VGVFGLWVSGSVASPSAQAVEPVRATSLLGIGAYGFLMAGIQLSVLSYLAVYLVDHVDLTETVAGLAIAVTLAGATVGRIVWGAVSDRLFHSRLLVLQLAALGAAVALTVLSAAVAHPSLWPVLFLLGFCAVGWNTVYVTVAAESVDASSVGKATGEALFFSYAGCVSMPLILGAVHDGSDSWLVTWLVAAAAALAALAACRHWASRMPRAVASAPS